MEEPLPSSCSREELSDEEISPNKNKLIDSDNSSMDHMQSTPQSQSSNKSLSVIKPPPFRRVSLTTPDHVDQEIKTEKALYESSRLSSSLTSFSINDKDASTNSDSEESSSSGPQRRKTSFSGPLFVSVPGLTPSSPGAGSTNSTPPHFSTNQNQPGGCPDSSHSSPVSSRKQCYSPSQGMFIAGSNARLSISSKRSGRQSPVFGLSAKSSPLIGNNSSRKRSLDTMRSLDESSFPASKRALFTNAVTLHVPTLPTSSCNNSPSSSTASPLMFHQSTDTLLSNYSLSVPTDEREKIKHSTTTATTTTSETVTPSA